MAAPRATAAMSRDHMEIVAMTDELQQLERRLHDADMSNVLQTNARRVLYGLYALVKLHFTEEEEIYVPVMEKALNAGQASEMFDRMGAAAAVARRSA